jgi:hypothetical protein
MAVSLDEQGIDLRLRRENGRIYLTCAGCVPGESLTTSVPEGSATALALRGAFREHLLAHLEALGSSRGAPGPPASER